MTIAVTFPGQGSQKPGFLEPWLDEPQHRETLEVVSDAIDIDLIKHGTESDAETLRDTAIAQPLIVAAGILVWDALTARFTDRLNGVVVAGHSVGEISAAYAAGVFDAATAVRFVARRAELMAADAASTPTGMAAVLGGEPDQIVAQLERHGAAAANFNGGGQIVAAGSPEALAAVQAEPPAGSRVIPLKVAGAFHTHYMNRAHETLATEIEQFAASDPQRALLTNFDGTRVNSGTRFRQLLVDQVNQPVRWDRCMNTLSGLGVTGLVEAPPSGTLVGLAKRGMRGTPTVALASPGDLDAVAALLDSAAE
ncbi:ACP S-malonyltransferase [uncultured Gulosibacter sp.]|uniref:ACP S-malonyltransferase n=1 Tax=uncultured Gulosibacter sp. TaxID=1339167 RepID=UPI00288AB090|nr:ACP S-malonyltransferase [uncultured Gulosibacter sp.]